MTTMKGDKERAGRKTVRRIQLVFTMALAAVLCACRADKTVIASRDLPEAERVATLGKYIVLRSAVIRADYRLFNVNFDPWEIPGASGADYKIVLWVAPPDTADWIKDRGNQLTSVPVSRDWTAEVVDGAEQNRLSVLDFVTYQNETSGYTYTLWVNKERGVILIRYVVR
jgi:hypothetical protein